MSYIERNLMVPTPCHTSVLFGLMYINEIFDGFVMLFHAFIRILKEKELLEDGLVTVEEQATMFLYTLAKNASNYTVQERFQISGDTVNRHFHGVLKAISQLSSEIITPPFHTSQYIRSRSKF